MTDATVLRHRYEYKYRIRRLQERLIRVGKQRDEARDAIIELGRMINGHRNFTCLS